MVQVAWFHLLHQQKLLFLNLLVNKIRFWLKPNKNIFFIFLSTKEIQMKKLNLVAASLIALLGGAVVSQAALAGPNIIKFHFICPKVTGTSETTLVHNGKSIQGYGTAYFQDKRTSQAPFFAHNAPANVPDNLKNGGYTSSDTGYNVTKGRVTCYYKSSLGYDTFQVDYNIKYGSGGLVSSSSPTQITISKFIG